MPIYEYQCSHCRYYLEVIQKITDAKLKKCPSCGRSTLQKLMSAPVFRLKGSGWYETDFKSEQEKKRNLAAAEKEPPAAESKDKPDKPETAAKPAAAESKPEAPPSGAAAARPAPRKPKSAAKPVARPAARRPAKP